ncbi:ssDNA endonuclease and repair protein rad10 [Boothiomyces sp. JEL0838]|nr:ssDNA endonuclease and repair protein rad10 [Boothiomyces sp. JEL0838]
MKIRVNSNQKGNPILQHFKAIWEYADIKADYQVGKHNGVLFLSLRYHKLHPEYIFTRIKDISGNLNILLLLVDADSWVHIREINRFAWASNFTLILAWSNEDAAKYIELFNQYENKPADVIKERIEKDHFSRLSNFLTDIRTINKTDVITLTSNFNSLYDVAHASTEELKMLPGLGDTKAAMLKEIFQSPFISE